MMDRMQITIPSHPKYLKLVRSVVQQIATELEFSKKESHDITLAVDEACTNIIKHSYCGDCHKDIIIEICTYEDRLELVIKDFGKKTDPQTIQHRSLEDVKPGGLGVFFIKKIMDEVTYDTSPDVGTELHLTKYLHTARCNNKKRSRVHS